MYTQNVTINNEVGLHARPATFFIQKANEFKSGIWVEKEDRRVNAKSLLGVLSLGIVKGTTITLIADGADEKADDAADNSSLDRIEALGQGQEVAGKGTGCADQERHDETDEGADDDVDIAKFKFDVLADFDAQRVDSGNNDVFSPFAGTAGDAVRMAADLNFGRALFFYRNNCTFFNFHRNPFFLSLL